MKTIDIPEGYIPLEKGEKLEFYHIQLNKNKKYELVKEFGIGIINKSKKDKFFKQENITENEKILISLIRNLHYYVEMLRGKQFTLGERISYMLWLAGAQKIYNSHGDLHGTQVPECVNIYKNSIIVKPYISRIYLHENLLWYILRSYNIMKGGGASKENYSNFMQANTTEEVATDIILHFNTIKENYGTN